MADGGITPAAAARELLRRKRARQSLVEFSQAITIPGAPVSEDVDEWLFKPIETQVAKHHIVTMEAIERCIRTDYGRLIICEPPGSAKSTYGSVVAPTWAMGAFPGIRVLMTSYAGTPIIRASKKARQIVASAEYSSIWERETRLVGGSNAADEWELTNGSGLYAAGLLGGITSSRCDLGIIDDPVAGREEADSETIRKKTRAAYDDDFLTRLKPKASIILIQTRWHESDLAGSILPENYKGQCGPVECRDGQVWEVLSIPAQCESADDPLGRQIGEYLWPEWFSERHWKIFKANSRTWSSLYQQRPVPEDGLHFKRDQFHRFAHAPEGCAWYEASDFAVTEAAGDKTGHLPFGIDEQGDIWIEDGFNGQVASDVAVAEGLKLVKRYKPQLWLGEKGVIEKAIEPEIRRQMRRTRNFAARELLPSVHDKLARVRGFQARVSAGTVHIKEGPFGDALIDQLIAFPAGRFDDLVDCCGLIGRALDLLLDGHGTSDDEEDRVEPFSRRHIEGLYRQTEREQIRRRRYYD
ncbi:hypothetical protein ACO2Q2_13290 [Dyella sp. KRB-257]|uniref:hypothetical protein n=1 Tax=Dyella sp. KRB-257 TaxID=3400915 RepID=UPI003C03339B